MAERGFDVEALNWLDEYVGTIRSEIRDAALAAAENDTVYVSDVQVAANNREQQLAYVRADNERLNQLLRETGYGQGQIDAYAAQCEENERLRAERDAGRKAARWLLPLTLDAGRH